MVATIIVAYAFVLEVEQQHDQPEDTSSASHGYVIMLHRSQLARIRGVKKDAFAISRKAINQLLAFDLALCLFVATLTIDSLALEEERKAYGASGEPRVTLYIMKVAKHVHLQRRMDHKNTLTEAITIS